MTRASEPVQTRINTAAGRAGSRTDTHPAFGVAVVTRGTGNGRALFQSDVLHRETITLRVSTAERTRDLSHDWTHPLTELLEVEFSLAQWGALVSSIGIGSGVPCTIRSTADDRQVADLPYQPRLAESISEVRASARKLADGATETLQALEDAVAAGKISQIRKALRDHASSIQHIEANSAFLAKSMQDAAEHVVAAAKSDIEAHILGAQRIVGGQASIESPAIPTLAVES